MLKYLWNFLKSLEQWDKYESPSYVVIEQVRGGGRDDYPFLGKRKKFDLAFHRQLEQYFPDWDGRMDYQKKQEKLFKSAMGKKREIKRLRMKENPKFYTKKELDAIDYFQGNGIYVKYQDKRKKQNIFDTRQSFLLKMHDDKLRNDFLNNLNSRKN